MRGVKPSLVRCSMSAPFLNKRATTSTCPFQQANVSGLSLLESLSTLSCAPSFSRKLTTLTCPASAANIRAVQPSLVRCSTFALRCSNSSTICREVYLVNIILWDSHAGKQYKYSPETYDVQRSYVKYNRNTATPSNVIFRQRQGHF